MAAPTSETDSTNTSNPPSISIPVASPIPIQNVHHHISEKLTQDNYILWQFLMVLFLEGHNLFGYVDGTFPQPPKLILDRTSGLLILNPDHSPWYHQDRIIFSPIISTLFVETLPHVIGLTTSQEVWVTLETLFAMQSQSRILQLKEIAIQSEERCSNCLCLFPKSTGNRKSLGCHWQAH
jgi:hypothetical protein